MYSQFFPFNKKLERLFATYGESVEYQKGQHLSWGKDKSDWVFFLESGLVRMSFSLPGEEDRIIGYFVPGHVFAHTGSFMNDPSGEISYTAEIGEECVSVFRMRRNVFLKHLRSNTEVSAEYVDMVLKNQRLLIDRVVYQGEKGLQAKCVRWILFMIKYYGITKGNRADITVSLTQEVMANFLYSTRESLNGILRELADKKLILLSRKRISVKDIKGLQKLLK